MSMKNLMCKPCWFWLRFILHFYGNFFFLSYWLQTCWRLEEPTTIDHTELGRSKIVLPQDWSEKPNKNLLKLCCFASFYICYTRSFLPLSPGSGLPSSWWPRPNHDYAQICLFSHSLASRCSIEKALNIP